MDHTFCFTCKKILDLTKPLESQFCICGVFLCSSVCGALHVHEPEKEAADEEAEDNFNTFITTYPCCVCGWVTDVRYEPSAGFRYCSCARVFCSTPCFEKGQDSHSKHYQNEKGYPCKARAFQSEKGKIWLGDRAEFCGHCDQESDKLEYFCEACLLYFCGGQPNTSCFTSHSCVRDA